MFLRESASNQNWKRWIFRWKIIVGGQINDLWKGKECSFPFIPVTSSSTSCTPEGLFEMTWHHSKTLNLWCISCFWNYRDKETPSVVLHPVPWHCREPQLITNLDCTFVKYTLGFVYPRMGGGLLRPPWCPPILLCCAYSWQKVWQRRRSPFCQYIDNHGYTTRLFIALLEIYQAIFWFWPICF